MASEYVLFDEYTRVTDIDASKYERVARLTSHGSEDVNVTLDINTELYPVNVNDNLHIQLSQTLNDDLKDAAEYIMYGKIYRFDEGKGEKTNVFISFGGLLMRIEGSYRKLSRMQHVMVRMSDNAQTELAGNFSQGCNLLEKFAHDDNVPDRSTVPASLQASWPL